MLVAGTVLYGLAWLAGAIQTAMRVQTPRPLTDREAALMRRVFGGSLDPSRIRIVAGRVGLFGLSGRAITIGTTIYLKRFDTTSRPDVLVHECTHVWQFRVAGPRYAAQALLAQWFVTNAYNWRDEIARGHRTWREFNREAQAQFVQDVFRGTGGAFFDDPATATFTHDGTDYTDLARTTITALRAGKD